MGSLLMDRLAAARRQRFVGRSGERALFRSALEAEEFPFVVLYLFGSGGVGKTTLLREFAYLATQMQTPGFYIDSRNIEPSPEVFLTVLRQSLGLGDQTEPGSWLAAQAKRAVILLDTVELLAPIEAWLREYFLPGLPANVLVVMAGRNPPPVAWRTDPGWAAMMKVIPLRNLSAEESREYLARCQVPLDEHGVVWDFTRGHPLALSLVVDVFAQRPGGHFQPEEAPDVIKTLLDQFVQKAPSPAHRAALEACALVRLTNEALLAALLQMGDVHELFEWLRSLSFIEMDRRGLFPHDLAREALVADVRWRNPEWYAELHSRARAYYISRVQQGDAEEQGRVLSDYVYLHRDNPVVRPYFEWQASSMVFADTLRPEDAPALVEMVRRHEGEEAGRWAAEWFERQPKGVNVVRFASGEPQGMVVALALEKIDPALRGRDPAVRSVWQFLEQSAPLRPGETATLFRFWLAHDTYQEVSPVQSRIFFTMVQHYLTTPRLAYTFLPCANPTFWQAVFAYADLARIEAADYIVGGRRYGVYGHDWRTITPMAWLALLAERELDAEIRPETTNPAEAVAILSQEEFAEAVRDALRDFTNPNALRNNPLLQARIVLRRCGPNKSSTQRIELLQKLLRETTALLQKSPKQIKLYRALQHTYFEPAPTQEQAAELLDLPFSTYRRHLRAGLNAIAEQLWQQEIG
jgi:hypothetical protein